MPDMPTQPLAIPPSLYANHVQLEPNDYDVRIVFGEQLQRDNTVGIRQLIGVRLSWLEAKLFSHFLQVTLAAHEMQNGKIRVPPGVIPPPPSDLTPEEYANNPKFKEIQEELTKMNAEFVAKL